MTSGSIAAGFLSVLQSAAGRPGAAVALIVGAALLDAFDGSVARARGGGSAFGANLDSLADMVSFGVAPAMVLYSSGLHALPVAGTASCVGFALCSAWRLARFPLCQSAHVFIGCPAPAAALIVALFALLDAGAAVSGGVTVVASLLMVSEVRVPTQRTARVMVASALQQQEPDASEDSQAGAVADALAPVPRVTPWG
jgi:CDP-diacylglycerol--serine O-phosphatidyltransferase